MEFLSDIRKSVASVLYERLTSPFYGAFFFSWLVWNWRVWYVLVFAEFNATLKYNNVECTKLEYLEQLLHNPIDVVWVPLLGSFIASVVIPFLANGYFWMGLQFTHWKRRQQQRVYQQRLLTFEESVRIQSLVDQKGEEHRQEKNRLKEDLESVTAELEALRRNSNTLRFRERTSDAKQEAIKKLLSDERYLVALQTASEYELKGYVGLSDEVENQVLNELISLGLLEKSIDKGYPKFELTPLGREVYSSVE